MARNLLICFALFVACAVLVPMSRRAAATVDLEHLRDPNIRGICLGMKLDDVKRLHPGWTTESDPTETGIDVWYLTSGFLVDVVGLELYDGQQRVLGSGDAVTLLPDFEKHADRERKLAEYECGDQTLINVYFEDEKIVGVVMSVRHRPVWIGNYPPRPPGPIRRPWDRPAGKATTCP